MKDLYIIGAGGFGREVAWLIERINQVNLTWNIKGFIDDNQNSWGTIVGGYTVAGGSEYLINSSNECWVVCAVGNAKVRKRIIECISGYEHIKFATLIDPSVLISNRVEIGEGSIICGGTIATVDIVIGSHVIVNLDCTLGHDDVIKDFVTIYPSVNVSGNINIGECVEIGTGTQLIQGIEVGEGTIIGAGATVVKSLPANCTAVGSPAKPIKFHNA